MHVPIADTNDRYSVYVRHLDGDGGRCILHIAPTPTDGLTGLRVRPRLTRQLGVILSDSEREQIVRALVEGAVS